MFQIIYFVVFWWFFRTLSCACIVSCFSHVMLFFSSNHYLEKTHHSLCCRNDIFGDFFEKPSLGCRFSWYLAYLSIWSTVKILYCCSLLRRVIRAYIQAWLLYSMVVSDESLTIPGLYCILLIMIYNVLGSMIYLMMENLLSNPSIKKKQIHHITSFVMPKNQYLSRIIWNEK